MSNTITRADLAARIGSDNIASPDQVTKVLEVALNELNQALGEGEDIKITSFGTFVLRSKSARVGRNPKTGTEAVIDARQVVTFRASPILKNKVAGNI